MNNSEPSLLILHSKALKL